MKRKITMYSGTGIVLITVVLLLVFNMVIHYYPFYNFSDFEDASVDERRIINEFYTFVPEMISVGRIFDVKFNSDYEANITVVKKAEDIVDYSIDLECYYLGELVWEKKFVQKSDNLKEKMGLVPVSSSESNMYIIEDLISYMYDVDDYHYYSGYNIVLDYNNLFERIVDEVKITFSYRGYCETHILKYSETNDKELLRLKMNSYFENQSASYEMHLYSHLKPSIRSLVIRDFYEWHSFAEAFMSEYERDSGNFETVILDEIGFFIFYMPEYITYSLADDQFLQYEQLYRKYDKTVD